MVTYDEFLSDLKTQLGLEMAKLMTLDKLHALEAQGLLALDMTDDGPAVQMTPAGIDMMSTMLMIGAPWIELMNRLGGGWSLEEAEIELMDRPGTELSNALGVVFAGLATARRRWHDES